MKKLILIIIIILYNVKLNYAQNYYTFPMDSTNWQVNCYWLDVDKSYFLAQQDTFVNDTQYSKVYWSNYEYPNILMALMREENKKVYIKFEMNYLSFRDTSEFVLYDFNLNIGDTFFVPYRAPLGGYSCFLKDTVIVTSVDSVIINGLYRRQIHLSPISGIFYQGVCDNQIWIEGIGSLVHTFYCTMSKNECFESLYETVCVTQNNESIYQANNSDCSFPNFINLKPDNFYLKIWPNPASDRININFNNTECTFFEVSIYNSSGVIIKKEIFNDNIFDILISNFSTGLYILEIKNKNGNYFFHKINVNKN